MMELMPHSMRQRRSRGRPARTSIRGGGGGSGGGAAYTSIDMSGIDAGTSRGCSNSNRAGMHLRITILCTYSHFQQYFPIEQACGYPMQTTAPAHTAVDVSGVSHSGDSGVSLC